VSIGLIAILDDIAALAKVAAASLDDVAGQAARAGVKAAGVVVDDTAVTPRYVVGFCAARELPIVAKIAKGSLRNKLVFLLPAAVALKVFAPWAITPLLMLGGAYLCYEGAEKVFEAVLSHNAHERELVPAGVDARTLEDEKVASAIRTDFILSAEITAITLAALPQGSIVTQAVVLAVVGAGITGGVYGAVALTVKADDVGAALARNSSASAFGSLSRAVGRALVVGMPAFLQVLSGIGTAAMIWVGGGIILHGLEELGSPGIAQAIHGVADQAAHAVPAAAGAARWIVTAAGSGVLGLLLGGLLIPIVAFVLAPAWKALVGRRVR
jgi:predicted DNA repair protein MutK